MAEHKNKNEAKGNFIIYQIFLNSILFKFGKADADRLTQSSGLPTRLHQQIRKWTQKGFRVAFRILETLRNLTTKEAKDLEAWYIEEYKKQHGHYPEGNEKRPKS